MYFFVKEVGNTDDNILVPKKARKHFLVLRQSSDTLMAHCGHTAAVFTTQLSVNSPISVTISFNIAIIILRVHLGPPWRGEIQLQTLFSEILPASTYLTSGISRRRNLKSQNLSESMTTAASSSNLI